MELKLKAKTRERSGKGAARKVRAQGYVPAVIYGHGTEPRALEVRKEDLQDVISSEAGTNVLLDLEIVEGKQKDNHLVMIKELQKHPFKERLLHVDFLRVARDEKVTMKVPITLTGEEDAAGVKAGGTLQHNLWEVEIECLPTEVPDHVFADVAAVEVGEHLTVADLKIPPGVTLVTEKEDVIVTILAPRLAVEEVPTEEAEAEREIASAEEKPAEAAPPGGGEEE